MREENASQAALFGDDESPGYSLLSAHRAAEGARVSISWGETDRESPGGTHHFVRVSQCPHCHANAQEARPFVSVSPLPLTVVAETALASLPPLAVATNDWLPARGRRLLMFSDSRTEAARQGPRLTYQHELQVSRAAIARMLQSQTLGNPQVIALFENKIADLRETLKSNDLDPSVRVIYEDEFHDAQRKLKGFRSGGSMSKWSPRLAERDLLAEILDQETAAQHLAPGTASDGDDTWDQAAWERNRERVADTSLLLLGREFARPARSFDSLESLGLAQVTYPGLSDCAIPPELAGILPSAHVRENLARAWASFLACLCDTLRADGAITLGSDYDDAQYPYGAYLVGRWCAGDSDLKGPAARFVGATPRQGRRRFATEILLAAGLHHDEAESTAPAILRAAFQQLFDCAIPLGTPERGGLLPWLRRDMRSTTASSATPAIRIHFPELGLRRPDKLWRGKRTGAVWPQHALGLVPASGGAEPVEEIEPSALDHDVRRGRARREYLGSEVFSLAVWAEEHSAQLSPSENRRLQDLFKTGIRNVLSATTTMELGIDIGGLNAVMMTNVPPGKANYLQRAGRSGRRADGSALVITYTRPHPYDHEVFDRFGDYLDRPLRRPVVFLDRDRVTQRHVHAFLLGEFFRRIYPPDAHVGAMDAFGNMGILCGVALPAYWDRKSHGKPATPEPRRVEGLNAQPWHREPQADSLAESFLFFLHWIASDTQTGYRAGVRQLVRSTSLAAAAQNWEGFLEAVHGLAQEAFLNWTQEYDLLFKAWEAASEPAQANAIRYQLHALHDLTVIEALADRQFLPRYGFPIGVMRLQVIAPDAKNPMRSRKEDRYRLERGSLLALREYVPGSQLQVGGKLITSHGLLKHWTGAEIDNYLGFRGLCCTCTERHFFYSTSGDLEECPICGAPPASTPQPLLFPRHGFTGAAWDPPHRGPSTERVGSAEIATLTFSSRNPADRQIIETESFGDIAGARAVYREGGEILVYNKGEHSFGFAICSRCGYADSETHSAAMDPQLPKRFAQHAPLTSTSPYRTCWKPQEGGLPLRNQILAARETTDVLLLDFSSVLRHQSQDIRVMTTLGYAFQRAGAELLQLDPREFGVLLTPTGPGGAYRGIVLYDMAPGGAGHPRELLHRGAELLQRARDVLYVDADHHARCHTACLDCILSYSSQFAAAQGKLRSHDACDALEAIWEKGGSASTPPRREVHGNDGYHRRPPAQDPPVVPKRPDSTDRRLRAARERMSKRRR